MKPASYIISRLQEINRTLLPDFPGRVVNENSIALARSQVMALIGDLSSTPKSAPEVMPPGPPCRDKTDIVGVNGQCIRCDADQGVRGVCK